MQRQDTRRRDWHDLTRWLTPLVVAVMPLVGCTSTASVAPAPVVEAPRPADRDGDGIADASDKCPDDKEDQKPPMPGDGCPTTDDDGDGVVNASDKCPNEKEDGRPPDASDGCLTRDPDGDGILGEADKCPDQPETRNNFEDDDGCPDTPPRVQVTKTEVKINEKIQFAFGKATIDPASNDLLEDLADVINDNPQIEFIEVAGHADNIGNDKTNQTLTRQRAAAVTQALIKLGVDPHRMSPQGYGFYCPVDPGDSEEAREKNRRVEFKLLRVAGVDTGVATGCEKAEKAGVARTVVAKNAPSQAALEKARLARGPKGKKGKGDATKPPAVVPKTARPPSVKPPPPKTPKTTK